MRASLVLLLACVVLAFQLQGSEAQFSFSLPGKWGNGKRANTAAWGKRGECGEVDPEAIFSLYKIVEVRVDASFRFFLRRLFCFPLSISYMYVDISFVKVPTMLFLWNSARFQVLTSCYWDNLNFLRWKIAHPGGTVTQDIQEDTFTKVEIKTWLHDIILGVIRIMRCDAGGHSYQDFTFNRLVTQIPHCISPVSLNTPFCNRNMHMCAHFCYKMLYCRIFVKYIVGYVRWV